ncbi:phospholipase D-like domain-containing protein [Paenibacillus sp. FSL L8-0333]|uniref:phospholipase D-like domain-containing protein n=1 Tax=unclassified Paenibacillus TaxID=185978 RepID=UPI0030D12693
MEEHIFLKTMIEMVKYDDLYKSNRDKLLGILRHSMIAYRKTSDYTRVPNQRKEYIDLRVPVPLLKTANELKAEFDKLAGIVYIDTEEYSLWGLFIKPKPVELADEEPIKEHDAIFDEIKDTIIQGIRNAKYTIWAAVAWFTDKEIFDELLLRKNAGVQIRIITSDEESNRFLITKLVTNFETIKVPLTGKNRLHDKFCIIDFEFVMHGSYNWSKNARENDETLATALDRDFVRKFADEFMRLYVENKN